MCIYIYEFDIPGKIGFPSPNLIAEGFLKKTVSQSCQFSTTMHEHCLQVLTIGLLLSTRLQIVNNLQ